MYFIIWIFFGIVAIIFCSYYDSRLTNLWFNTSTIDILNLIDKQREASQKEPIVSILIALLRLICWPVRVAQIMYIWTKRETLIMQSIKQFELLEKENEDKN